MANLSSIDDAHLPRSIMSVSYSFTSSWWNPTRNCSWNEAWWHFLWRSTRKLRYISWINLPHSTRSLTRTGSSRISIIITVPSWSPYLSSAAPWRGSRPYCNMGMWYETGISSTDEKEWKTKTTLLTFVKNSGSAPCSIKIRGSSMSTVRIALWRGVCPL